MTNRAFLGIAISLALVFSPVPLSGRNAEAQVAIPFPPAALANPVAGLAVLTALLVEYAVCADDPAKAGRTIIGRLLEQKRAWELSAAGEGMILQASLHAEAALKSIRQRRIAYACPSVHLTAAQAQVAASLVLLLDEYQLFESMESEGAFRVKTAELASNDAFMAQIETILSLHRSAFPANGDESAGFRRLLACFTDPGVVWQVLTLGVLGVAGSVLLLAGFFSANADWRALQSGRPEETGGKKGGVNALYFLGPLSFVMALPYFSAMKVGLKACSEIGKAALITQPSERMITTFATGIYGILGAASAYAGYRFLDHGRQVLRALPR